MDEDVKIENYDDEEDVVEEVVEEQEEVKEEVKEVPKEEPKEKHWAIDAMHEERERRKEMQRQIEEYNLKMQKMEERFKILMQKEEEKKIPAYEENPGEHLKARLEDVGKKLSTLTEREQKEELLKQQQQQHQAFVYEFEVKEAEYAKEHKDYYDAVKFLGETRVKEYITAGYDPASAAHLAQQDALGIAWNARQSGKNGADVFYNLAKLRGYNPSPKKSEIEKLKDLSENVEKSRTLGPSGGKDGDLTLADLAEMSDADFDKATAGENWRKLMGG